jgi:hypothetical protein
VIIVIIPHNINVLNEIKNKENALEGLVSAVYGIKKRKEDGMIILE